MIESLILIMFTVVLNTFGQFTVKAGIDKIGTVDLSNIHSIIRAFSSWIVLGGFAIYFASSLIWLSILSKVQLSWAFPILSLSYVLTVLLSPVFFHENFSAQRLAGTLVICVGVFLVGRTY
jgi:drug/metabolite transporter (DMT)-like permease